MVGLAKVVSVVVLPLTEDPPLVWNVTVRGLAVHFAYKVKFAVFPWVYGNSI